MIAFRWRHGAAFWYAALALLLASCGGGGGGGGGGGSPSTSPTLSVSTTSVTFTAVQNAPTPAPQNVVASLSNANETVFVDNLVLTGTGFSATVVITSPTTANIVITPFPTLAPGTYTGTIRVRVCSDSLCQRDIPGSPKVINVTYTIQPQTGLRASPTSLSFTQVQGGTGPSAQMLGLSDVGNASYAWNASIVYQNTTTGWLTLNGGTSASAATLPASVSVGISPLATVGTFTALVRVTATGKPTLDVPVTYTVTEPQLSRSPLQLNFSAAATGSLPVSQDVTLSTQGNLTIDYSTGVSYGASQPTGWLSVTSPTGTAPRTVSVGVNTTNLTAGTYNATLSFTTPGGQTVTVPVIYTLAASSLTFSPSSSSFTITPSSTGAALAQTMSVGSTGQPISWTAASNQSWVTVSPASGVSGSQVTFTLDSTQLGTLDPGQRSATVTFSYNQPGGGATNTPITVSLDLQLPKVTSVNPYVAISGAPAQVIVRGSGFNNAGTANLKIGASTTSYTVLSDTEIRLTHPSLAAGGPLRVSIENQLGLTRSTADLVVVDAPGFAAATLAYPDSAAKRPLNIIYDPERQALLVAVRPPGFGTAVGTVYRYSFLGSSWSATPTFTTLGNLTDTGLTLDGKKLLATTNTNITPLDPVTLSAGTPASVTLFSGDFLSGLAMANDGKALVTVGSQFGNVYSYSVADGTVTSISGAFLYGARAAGSADGSRVVFAQGSTSPPQSVYQYNASTGLLASTSALVAGPTQPALDRRATRIVIDGSDVYDSNFQLVGTLPPVAGRAITVVSPDATRAYTYWNNVLHVFDISATPPGGVYAEIATASVPTNATDPTDVAAMSISPDGGTLFIAGDLKIVVMPKP